MALAGLLQISLLLWRAVATTEPIPRQSLKPEPRQAQGQARAMNQDHDKCPELFDLSSRGNSTGTFCARVWDGLLCWEETSAGSYVTQKCPEQTDTNHTMTVTKYCDYSGTWMPTARNCQRPTKILEVEISQLLRHTADEQPAVLDGGRGGSLESMLLVKKQKCDEEMKPYQPYTKPGLYCGRTWDGYLCWDDTPAGTLATQNCPDYFRNFDVTAKASKYCGEDGKWFHHPDSGRSWTDYTHCDASHEKMSRNMKLVEDKYRCLQRINQDPPFNRSGPYCSRHWDGWLCWQDTAAGSFASQNCPDYLPDQDPSEKATKYCGEDGQWTHHPERNTSGPNSTLCSGSKESMMMAGLHSGDSEESDEAALNPMVNPEERKKILDSQYKCFAKMNRDLPYNKTGLFCSRNWDGWLCWEDTPAGTYTSQNCPNYFVDFDPTEKATKYCGDDGQWFRHPDTNRTWSNYTLCNENTKAKLKSAYILFYMAIVGHALSIVSLLISLAIFFYFRSLSCQRITLHKNLFCSYVLNSALTILYLVVVVNNPEVVNRNPVGCKVLHFFHMYMLGCNYFWMLCEGIYLHTLIVVAVFAEEQHLHWYYLLGWGFPLVPASIHAVARKTFFDDNCWMSVETHLLYAVHGPIVAALLVNLFFLLNIIRVLVTKLRDTHRAESNMYMKAVRATLILVPLLGIQFVIFPWRPENRLAGEVYEYIMHILMHYQGLLVATIFCFFNGEVQAALKRQWMQYKTQWGQRRKDHCSMRSTSYTATSITEVPAFMYHHDSEHLNGRHSEDSELVALKAGETYA
ncbi:calcitonin gene-related peptide type 1 receptor [Synchiropus picturatus]